MVITVVTMGMVEAAIDQIVHMVAMRHGLMSAAGSVDVAVRMTFILHRGAVVRIGRADLDHMLIHMVTVRVMQVPVMQIVDMIAMAHSRVPAIRPVLVVVVFMMGEFAVRHVMLLH